MSSSRVAILLCLGVLSVPPTVFAQTLRLAVVVGNNVGSGSRPRLRYAEADAQRMAHVLAELGDVAPENLRLLQGKKRAELDAALSWATERVRAARREKVKRVALLFYFSGHSDGEALELGKDRVAFGDLVHRLEETGADLRLGIVDSCKSGALLAVKGAKLGPAFEVRLRDELVSSGQAFLTSSAEDEVALESRALGGSVFSHHLIAGLHGAADVSGNGQVTLSEVYQYAYSRTVHATASTMVGTQHPAYAFKLNGRGDVALTDLRRGGAQVVLPSGFDRAVLTSVSHAEQVLELTRGAAPRVAVSAGAYDVQWVKDAQVLRGRVNLADGEARTVALSELTRSAATDGAAKGSDRRFTEFAGLSLGMTKDALWNLLRHKGQTHVVDLARSTLDGEALPLPALTQRLSRMKTAGVVPCAVSHAPASTDPANWIMEKISCAQVPSSEAVLATHLRLAGDRLFAVELEFSPAAGREVNVGVIGKFGTEFVIDGDAGEAAAIQQLGAAKARCKTRPCRTLTWGGVEEGAIATALVTDEEEVVALRLVEPRKAAEIGQALEQARLHQFQETTRRLGF